MTIFLRLLDIEKDQQPAFLRQVIEGTSERQFEVDPASFSEIPGSPFAYWVSDKARALFKILSPFESNGRSVRQGLATADDFRFVRAWWEITNFNLDKRWLGFAKGGKFLPFYSDVFLSINWLNDGHEMKAWAGSLYNESHWSRILKNVHLISRPGLTWPLRTTSGLGLRVLPAGCAFGHKGPAAFVENDSPFDLLAMCALTNSAPFGYLVGVQLAAADAAARSYEVGVIQRTPVPNLVEEYEVLAGHARRSWSLRRTLETLIETSHAFILPAALRTRLGPFDPSGIEAELLSIQSSIDDLALSAYDLDAEDRAAIEAWSSKSTISNGDVETETGEDYAADCTDTSASLHSWAVGVAFGRFDLRLATYERQPPQEPEPFDPLPTRSPGMIPEADDAQFPARPILVDDLGHSLDLAAQVGEVLDRVGFPPESPETLRRWLARDFFPLHIKMYSKSRRKAPIYWQLATPAASYSVWLYIHAFSRDTLYNVQEIAATKLQHEERKLDSLRSDLGPNPKAAERKALAAQETFVEELRNFLDEVKRVAPLWNPDLDDGVIINFAPLWRLVPHHKPWQKELKATWDALCAGEYDWAHLAMHLWPERVVPKCASDRSLAIAHGLEDVFWIEGQDGKWKPRPIPARPVEELVQERTSPAVKAALKSLLEAPVVTAGGGRRTRKAKS